MIRVRMKLQSTGESNGWASRLQQLRKGYKVTSRSMPFGTLIHQITRDGISFQLKQGCSRALRSEADSGNLTVQEIIRDLMAVGALFPVEEANTWSL